MEHSRGQGGKKRPARVQIFYFPKRRNPSRERSTSVTDCSMQGSTPVTINTDEAITEPGVQSEQLCDRPRKRLGQKKMKSRRMEAVGMRRRISELLAFCRSARKGKIRLSPSHVGEISFFGHYLFEQGQLLEARALLEELVSVGITDAFPYTMLGTIYLALDDEERALELFEAALKIDGNDLAALVYRGEICLNRRKLKPALKDLSRAIEIGHHDDPFVARARRLLRLSEEIVRRRRI